MDFALDQRPVNYEELLDWTPTIAGMNITRARYDGRTYPNHSHNFMELNLVLAGCATQNINGTPHNLTSGDVVILRGGDQHAVTSSSHWDFVNLMFKESLSGLIGDEYPILSRGTGPWNLDWGSLEQLKALLLAMEAEFSRGFLASPSLLRSHLVQILVFLGRHLEAGNRAQASGVALGPSVAYLEQNLGHDLTVEALAALAHQSTSQFTRNFRTVFGLPPMQYLKQLRVKKAAYLLETTRLSLTEIGDKVGIADPNYFSRLFRSVMGQSPREYRKSQQCLYQEEVHP